MRLCLITHLGCKVVRVVWFSKHQCWTLPLRKLKSIHRSHSLAVTDFMAWLASGESRWHIARRGSALSFRHRLCSKRWPLSGLIFSFITNQGSGTYGSRARCGSFDDSIWLAWYFFNTIMNEKFSAIFYLPHYKAISNTMQQQKLH